MDQFERNFDPQFENERLHFAAQRGELEIVRQLMAEGRPVSEFDDLGFTPLHYATKEGHVEVMKALIAAGANVNAHDERQIGNTPLGEVADHCSFAVAKLLVEAGADPRIPGWMQLTALHKSAERKSAEGVQVHQLLEAAARRLPVSHDLGEP
jgi:ankyrin repeat protein